MKEWASADAVNDILDLQLKPCNLANSFKSYLRPPLYHLIHIFINTTIKMLWSPGGRGFESRTHQQKCHRSI